MSPENIAKLQWLARDMYHTSIENLPDELFKSVEDFVAEIGFVGAFRDGEKVFLADVAQVRFEMHIGVTAFVFPSRPDLSDDQLRRIYDAQKRLYDRSQEIAV